MVAVRRLLCGAVIAAAFVVPSAAAFAHVDAEPAEAPAGSSQDVGFTVEHGCDGSPTNRLDMRLPDGVSSVVAKPPAGWRGDVLPDGTVTFSGGPLVDNVEATFVVSMVLPATPDATIHFPFVQRCEVGEIRWIDIPTDPTAPEPEHPAPSMHLTASGAAPGESSPTSLPASTLAVPSTASPTEDGASSGNGGAVAIAVASLVVAALVAAAFIVRARKRRT